MSFRALAPAVFALQASVAAAPAWAQRADAGAEHPATRPATAPPATEPPKPAEEPSGVLPKTIDPAILSERTRASLQERTAGRHATSLPSAPPALRSESGAVHDLAPAGSLPSATTSRYRPGNEPLRRGEAHMKRVQAVETDEGVTLLSNRMQPSTTTPAFAALTAQTTHDRMEQPPLEDEALVASRDTPSLTETRSLRPQSARAVNPNTGTGLGWLLWPFVLFVATGAVLSTLWIRKKT
jgi:hypothetical protein